MTLKNYYTDDTEKKLFYALILLMLFKCAAAVFFPLTGDEAYFITWGKSFEQGYYDHPPLTGWVVFLLSKVVDSYIFYRFFVILLGLGCGLLVFRASQEFFPQNARKAAYLFLLSPVHLLFILFSNDVLLCFFSLWGALLLFLGLKRDRLGLTAVGGIVFGLAFMSKYLSFPVLLSLFVFAVLSGYRRRFVHFALFSLMIVPFFAQNMYYNYTHCWNNIMFNLINRTSGSDNIFASLLNLSINMLYVSTPWILYFIFKNRKNIGLRLFPFVMSSVCIGFYALLSARRVIDMHWLLILVPYIFILAGAFEKEQLAKSLRYTVIFTAVHVIIGTAALLAPIELLKEKKVYKTIAAVKYSDELCGQLAAYPDMPIVTKSYAMSSLMDTLCKREVHVMFGISKHGRQDDESFDIKALDGKEILFFHRHKFKAEEEEIADYFRQSEIKQINARGADYYVLHGKGFNYEMYRDEYLTKVRKQFYQFPEWLKPKKCNFIERYFEEECLSSADSSAP